MKNKIKFFALGSASTLLASALVVSGTAAVLQKTIDINYRDIKICVDGVQIDPKDAAGNTVEPFISEGTTYLPVRAVASALGKDVSWDGETSTVYIGANPADNSYSRTNPAPIGTVQTYVKQSNYSSDYSASLSVTNVIRGQEAWEKIKAANMFNSEPDAGYEYIMVEVDFNLLSSENDEAVRVSSYDFSFYSTDFVEYDSTFVTYDEELSTSLYAGGNKKGYVIGMINTDDVAPKLEYGDDYYGKTVWFSLS